MTTASDGMASRHSVDRKPVLSASETASRRARSEASIRLRSDRPEAVSFIGVEPEAAPLRFRLLRARVVGRHRRRIDDDARAGRGNGGGTLSRGGVAFRLDRLRRERGSGWRSGRDDRLDHRRCRLGRRGLRRAAAKRSSGVRQTKASSAPDGETGAQRSLMTPSATQALSRGARAARPSHSRTAP